MYDGDLDWASVGGIGDYFVVYDIMNMVSIKQYLFQTHSYHVNNQRE